MKFEFGFIGTGNMGGALAEAVCKKFGGASVLLANRTAEKAQTLAKKLGANCGTNDDVASSCKFIFLGVKPQMMNEVLGKVSDKLSARKDSFVLVTMAAGLDCSAIAALAGNCKYQVIRIMPNTPVSVGHGMILYCSQNVAVNDESRFAEALSAAGKLERIDEDLIDAGCAISGCGPAFVYMFIEALADGGVSCGLPRVKALEYAALTVEGAAALLLKSGKHPGELKDEVCSPAGSTIEGVRTLEEAGFRAAATDAVIAAFERTKDLKNAK